MVPTRLPGQAARAALGNLYRRGSAGARAHQHRQLKIGVAVNLERDTFRVVAGMCQIDDVMKEFREVQVSPKFHELGIVLQGV